MSVLEENEGAVDCGSEPQQHVGKVDPDGVLHALDALVSLGVLWDVHLAENAKDNEPEDEENNIHSEKGPSLEEGNGIDEDGNARNTGCHFSPNPFSVGVDVCLACAVKVNAIESSDGQSKDELNEADKDSHISQRAIDRGSVAAERNHGEVR